MKFNKITTATLLSLGLVSFSTFAQVENNMGEVNFTGSIIDAPCSISSDTVKQDVELGAISHSMLESNGTSTPTAFTIKLENCALEDDTAGGSRLKNGVNITFTGRQNETDKSLLALDGEAKGAGVVLTDGMQKVIPLGEATPLGTLTQGTNNIKFYAYQIGRAHV